MENPFKNLINKILPDENIHEDNGNFDESKIPLEMYEISGQDKITGHSFNRYMRDKTQDEIIKNEIKNPVFISREDILAKSSEKRISLVKEAIFSPDRKEQEIATRMLYELPLEEKKLFSSTLPRDIKIKLNNGKCY